MIILEGFLKAIPECSWRNPLQPCHTGSLGMAKPQARLAKLGARHSSPSRSPSGWWSPRSLVRSPSPSPLPPELSSPSLGLAAREARNPRAREHRVSRSGTAMARLIVAFPAPFAQGLVPGSACGVLRSEVRGN